jgi:hypothetical protein
MTTDFNFGKLDELAKVMKVEKRELSDIEKTTLEVINHMIYYDKLFSDYLGLMVTLYKESIENLNTKSLMMLALFISDKMKDMKSTENC